MHRLFIFVLTLQYAALAQAVDTPWPQTFSNGELITVYQPEVESWKDNVLKQRAAVSVQRPSSANPVYGVIWISAKTKVDAENRLVTLENVQITRGSFPSDQKRASKYLGVLRKQTQVFAQSMTQERLQGDLAISKAEGKHSEAKLDNTPPRVIYSDQPAVLVLVDGDPVLRDTSESNLKRVINTRALLVLNNSNGKYDLYLKDRWMESETLDGPWMEKMSDLDSLNDLKEDLADQKEIELFHDLKKDVVPKVYVSTRPAELVQTNGKIQLQPIQGTSLLYATNSSDNIFIDSKKNEYYLLLSGRWYQSKTLSGSWTYVSAKKLPADFAKIPNQHRKGEVLASIADTPQAKEAAVANEVPQTATVDRKEAKLDPKYDGKPELRPIEGTPLKYVVNSKTPVIQVDEHSYYAVENGVWFVATSLDGPWTVATKVPAVIYSIPPESPLYYVTFVKIYGSTPEVVYVGYTPGYLGSYYSSDGVVVYGTGYSYSPWVGTYWVGYPWTYGFGIAWGPSFAWGFGAYYYPWWGPWCCYSRPTTVTNVTQYNVYQQNVNKAAVRETWDRSATAQQNIKQWNQNHPRQGQNGQAVQNFQNQHPRDSKNPPSNQTWNRDRTQAPSGAQTMERNPDSRPSHGNWNPSQPGTTTGTTSGTTPRTTSGTTTTGTTGSTGTVGTTGQSAPLPPPPPPPGGAMGSGTSSGSGPASGVTSGGHSGGGPPTGGSGPASGGPSGGAAPPSAPSGGGGHIGGGAPGGGPPGGGPPGGGGGHPGGGGPPAGGGHPGGGGGRPGGH